MTDQEFLNADFDALLASMTLDEINARHEAIDASRAARADAEEAAYREWVASQRVPYKRARRRCIACGEFQQPESIRCGDCGESLPVVGEQMRSAELEPRTEDATQPKPRTPILSPAPRSVGRGGEDWS